MIAVQKMVAPLQGELPTNKDALIVVIISYTPGYEKMHKKRNLRTRLVVCV